MLKKFISSKDFLAGLFFMLVGILACWLASRYAMGSARQMGPGYFPTVLGGLLVILGGFGIVRARYGAMEPVAIEGLRPFIFIIGSFAMFGLLLGRFGLLLSGTLMLMAAAVASRQFKIKLAVIDTVIIMTFVYVVFILGLKLPLPLWPRL